MELWKVQRQIRRGSTSLIPKIEKLKQMSLCYPIEMAFYCLCVLLFFSIIFTTFILILFFLFLFHMFSFPHFISLFNYIVWLVPLFSLYCILIFLLSLHSCSNNTLLSIVYSIFWLSKSYISCHIIVVPVLLKIIVVPYNCTY